MDLTKGEDGKLVVSVTPPVAVQTFCLCELERRYTLAETDFKKAKEMLEKAQSLGLKDTCRRADGQSYAQELE